MKIITIIGNNYVGSYLHTRTACRALIIKDNEILLSYERNTDQYQLPGGGLEKGESDIECVIREVKEETGYIITTNECELEIDEYYGDSKFIIKYFIGKIVDKGETNLTENEKEVGMEPRFVSLEEALSIFASHEKYRDKQEMKSGMYLREYTALKELL